MQHISYSKEDNMSSHENTHNQSLPFWLDINSNFTILNFAEFCDRDVEFYYQ